MEDYGNNSLTPEETEDAAKALSILRDLGAKVSLAALAETFGKERVRKLYELRERKKGPEKESEFLFVGEADDLLRSAESSPGRVDDAIGMVLVLTMLCGLRPREIQPLEWEDIDFEAGALRLGGRDARRRRVVLMEPSALEWAKHWRDWTSARRAGRFPSGTIVRTLKPFRDWQRLVCGSHGGKKLTLAGFFRLLRGTFATMHVCALRKPEATAAALGHPGAAEALKFHYEGLVTTSMAQSFWNLLPRTHESAETTILASPAERRKEALKRWREARATREYGLLREGMPHLSLEEVKKAVEIVCRNPGRVEAAVGMRFTLGVFAGFRLAEIHVAKWEDIDLDAKTIVKRPTGSANANHFWGRRNRGAARVVPLHPTAVAWIAVWKKWALENGGLVQGPVVPRFTSFTHWNKHYAIPAGLSLVNRRTVEILANTYLAFRYADLQESHPNDPLRREGMAQSESFWSLLPPEGLVLPRVKHVARLGGVFRWVDTPFRKTPAESSETESDGAAGGGNEELTPTGRRKRKKTTGLRIPEVRRLMRTTMWRPGSLRAAPGAYLTLGLFVGLHTIEIERARWEDVEWTTDTIRIPKPEGHTDELGPKVVPLKPLARKWLRLWYQWAETEDGPPTGPIVPQPWRFLHWRRRERWLREREWPHDILRITYRERLRSKKYWSLEPEGVPFEPEILPGRAWRHLRTLEMKRRNEELQMAAARNDAAGPGGIPERAGGSPEGGGPAGGGDGEGRANGLVEAERPDPIPCPAPGDAGGGGTAPPGEGRDLRDPRSDDRRPGANEGCSYGANDGSTDSGNDGSGCAGNEECGGEAATNDDPGCAGNDECADGEGNREEGDA